MISKKILSLVVGLVVLLALAILEETGMPIEEAFSSKTHRPAETQATSTSSATSSISTTGIYHQVLKIVDGDTITISIDGKSETVRLIGIDTPETVDPRATVECFGKEASDKAKELLTGKRVRIEADPSQNTRDKYGRLLGYIYRNDGLFINEYMVQEGFAYEYTYVVPYQFQAEFKKAQADAQSNKKGLWTDSACGSVVKVSRAYSSPAAAFYAIPDSGGYTCSENSYNCGSFATQAESQSAYEACGGVSNDVHLLDRDADGRSCESLP